MATIGLDLAKSSVDFAGLDVAGKVVTRRRYTKAEQAAVTAQPGSGRIGREACCDAHHLGRVLLAQGHDVKLMPPKYVKPFVKRDRNDAQRGGLPAADDALRAGRERGAAVNAVAAPLPLAAGA